MCRSLRAARPPSDLVACAKLIIQFTTVHQLINRGTGSLIIHELLSYR